MRDMHSQLGGGASLGGALVTNASLATLGLGTLRVEEWEGVPWSASSRPSGFCFSKIRETRRRGNRDASARAGLLGSKTRSKQNARDPNETIRASTRGSDARDAFIDALNGG